MAEAAAPRPTPMRPPTMPIWEERKVEVTAARAVAMTWAPERSPKIPFFSGAGASCAVLAAAGLCA